MKVKFSYYVRNNGDGSCSVLFFDTEKAAEEYAGDDDERFTDGDCSTEELEFDDNGKLITPNPKRY